MTISKQTASDAGPDRARVLEALAEEFRTQEEVEWVEECGASPESRAAIFAGRCQDVSRRLAAFLLSRGQAALRVGGYYRDIPESYFAERGAAYEDGCWKHWWVESDGLIIDVTADQFHVDEEDSYRVVVTGCDDPSYRKIVAGEISLPA